MKDQGGEMTKPVLEKMVDDLAMHLWGPDSRTLYYTKSEIRKLAEEYAKSESDARVREFAEHLKESTETLYYDGVYGSEDDPDDGHIACTPHWVIDTTLATFLSQPNNDHATP